MAVTAKIDFVQGVTNPIAGRVIFAVTGVAVVCSNEDNTNVTDWTWTLLDVPQGELTGEDSALSVGPVLSTGPTLNVTPDVPGAYRVQLQVSDGVMTKTHINTILVLDEFGCAKPGYKLTLTELLMGLALNRGWTQLEERAKSLLRKIALMGGVARVDLYSGIAGNQETDSSGFEGKGVIAFNPAELSTAGAGGVARAITFEAVISVTPGLTIQVRLYNVTDGVVVPNTTLSTTSSTAVIQKSAALVVPTEIPNSEKLYEVQIRVSAGTVTPGARVVCHQARLKVKWT